MEATECESCRHVLPLRFLSDVIELSSSLSPTQTRPPFKSALLHDAFVANSKENSSPGVASILTHTVDNTPHRSELPLVNTAVSPYYYRRKPNCFAVAISNGVRGMVVGSVFGGAIGLSTAVQSGYRGSAVLSYVGQGALRNAAAFGSWTAVYGFTRCGLIHARGRDDMFNAAVAGAFTGGILTLASVRGYWRYNQAAILTNAGASAMVAVMFHALNQM